MEHSEFESWAGAIRQPLSDSRTVSRAIDLIDRPCKPLGEPIPRWSPQRD